MDMSKSLVEFKRFLAKSAPTLSEHEKKLANLMLAGFDEIGVSQPLNVIEANCDAKVDIVLKTASGFGGCNTAVLFKKIES